MRRSLIALLGMLGLLGFATFGYLGFQSAQVERESVSPVPLTVTVSQGDVILSVSAPGLLVGNKEILVAMGASGPLGEIFVQTGDEVRTGQRLARLANEEELSAAVEAAHAELLAAQIALDDLIENAPLVTAQAQLDLANAREALRKAESRNNVLQEGHRATSETIAAAEAALVIAKEELAGAERDFNHLSDRPEDDPKRARAQLILAEARKKRNQALATLNWYTGHPTEFQQAILDAEVALARANLIVAESVWHQVKDGPDPDELNLRDARIKMAEIRLAEAENELRSVELLAPCDGVLLEVNAKVGDYLTAGQVFILISDVRSLDVVITVIEEDMPLVGIGQPVELYFDARPDLIGNGIVKRIVPDRLPGDRPLYAVIIEVEELPADLMPGMTVDAVIITTVREAVLRLPKTLVRTRSDGTAKIEVWVNGLREERVVQVGLRGDSYVEILDGLRAGELVVGE